MDGLFSKNNNHFAPLAERLRPRALEDIAGQNHLLGEGAVLRSLIESDDIPSMIFWGPPGTGKTTLAEIIAQKTGCRFLRLGATSSGKADLKKIIDDAAGWRDFHGKRTVLFVDEIHRWNKAQQDALLPAVESGLITLIGATTENPSFEVVGALLSRAKVFILNPLGREDLLLILKRALRLIFNEEKIKISFEEGTPNLLIGLAGGDARALLGTLEILLKLKKSEGSVILLKKEDVKKAYLRANIFYDKDGEEHYNIISALHKSMRGLDADAALYWLARMLESGDDPLYVARRLIRFASEDIGLADPNALLQAVAAYRAAHYLGLPECNVCLAQTVVYLARAPKSNNLYTAYEEAKRDVKESLREPVPLHLRNAVTDLMKDLGYGKDYKYPPRVDERTRGEAGNPNFKEPAEQNYLPPSLKGKKYLK